jgi:hypothetical protein
MMRWRSEAWSSTTLLPTDGTLWPCKLLVSILACMLVVIRVSSPVCVCVRACLYVSLSLSLSLALPLFVLIPACMLVVIRVTSPVCVCICVCMRVCMSLRALSLAESALSLRESEYPEAHDLALLSRARALSLP